MASTLSDNRGRKSIVNTELSVDLNFRVGGAAGQGVQSIGGILSKTFARGGYDIFTHQDYESRIRGGHSFFHLRLSDKPVYAAPNKVNVLVALDDRTIEIHEDVMVPNSVIICDRKLREVSPEVERIHDIFDVLYSKCHLQCREILLLPPYQFIPLREKRCQECRKDAKSGLRCDPQA